MQVQMSDVVATHGIRRCIGMSAKLRKVEGTQIFHSAIRSSFIFELYSSTAATGFGVSDVTKSLIM
jgi:hypothetical protein